MTKYKFLPFDDQKIDASRKAWLADSAAGLAFPTETERLFEWVGSHREPTDHDSVAFGLFPEGRTRHVAHGICEVTIQRKSVRSHWIKMLRLHLKPSVDAQMQAGQPDNAMLVFTHCIEGTLDLQLAHSASTLKIYGRTNEQLAFLKVLVEHIDRNLGNRDGIKASIEGRFLTLNVD